MWGFESTVYRKTQDICIPVIEKFSSLSYKKMNFVCYSPERVNPGDKNIQ